MGRCGACSSDGPMGAQPGVISAPRRRRDDVSLVGAPAARMAKQLTETLASAAAASLSPWTKWMSRCECVNGGRHNTCDTKSGRRSTAKARGIRRQASFHVFHVILQLEWN